MNPVVIIGGGPAGIASAAHLAERGVETVLIERSKHLGGRAASFFYSQMDEEVDYGQHVLMRCCTRSLDLLRLLGQEDAVSFQPSLHVPMRSETKRGKITSNPLPGALHLLPSLLAYRFLSLPARINAVRAGLSLLLQDPGDVSFGKWLSVHGQKERVIATLWDPICVATLNARARDASARMARLVFQRGFFRRHGADIGLFTRPLSQIFASAIPYIESHQGRVHLETPVNRIIVDRGRAHGVELASGEIIEAHAIISAVPPHDLTPLLPSQQFLASLDRIAYAPIVNVHLWFDRSIMDEPFIIAIDSRIQAVFDVSTAHRERDKHHIVISQSAATDWIDMPVASIVDISLSELRKLLPRGQRADLIDSLVIKSRFATFVPSPGAGALRPATTTPIVGLFLAGDYTTTGWPSTIEGAVRSGFSAAISLLARR
ncbi:MAG TPA: FAD-dependent oxidoreductase [Candidatus Acetothermia bacterium]|nr:FAD-dependent oxidoreductase [Candidatus Acetothermia bacterium]